MESNTQLPAPPTANRLAMQTGAMTPGPPNKLPVFRSPMHQDGQPSKLLVFRSLVPAIAPQGSVVLSAAMLGVGRPPAPPLAMMENPWTRFVLGNNRLTLEDLRLQTVELAVYRESSGNALPRSSVDTGPCALNMQAELPSPDELSERNSGSEDELDLELKL